MDYYQIYYTIRNVIFKGEASLYMRDSEDLSLAVYARMEGKITDTYLISTTDLYQISEPFAFLAVDITEGKYVKYEELSEEQVKEYSKDEVEVSEELEKEYLEKFIEVRPCVFREIKEKENRKKIDEYAQVLKKIGNNYSGYAMIAKTFFEWYEELE